MRKSHFAFFSVSFSSVLAALLEGKQTTFSSLWKPNSFVRLLGFLSFLCSRSAVTLYYPAKGYSPGMSDGLLGVLTGWRQPERPAVVSVELQLLQSGWKAMELNVRFSTHKNTLFAAVKAFFAADDQRSVLFRRCKPFRSWTLSSSRRERHFCHLKTFWDQTQLDELSAAHKIAHYTIPLAEKLHCGERRKPPNKYKFIWSRDKENDHFFRACAPYDSNLGALCILAWACGPWWMTGEKTESRWLQQRHANCFQLIAAFCSRFIKWITVLPHSSQAELADRLLWWVEEGESDAVSPGEAAERLFLSAPEEMFTWKSSLCILRCKTEASSEPNAWRI